MITLLLIIIAPFITFCNEQPQIVAAKRREQVGKFTRALVIRAQRSDRPSLHRESDKLLVLTRKRTPEVNYCASILRNTTVQYLLYNFRTKLYISTSKKRRPVGLFGEFSFDELPI